MCYYHPLHRSRRFINQYFRVTDQNAKLFTRNHDMCFAEKSARMRPGSRWNAAWSKHWRQCVWLTCPTRTRDTLASRCSKRAARKLPRCGTGDRAKNTHCELSSFGPALFEIWWPDIYLGGPYGPVTDKMYWPELVRRSEKCAGPAGQCLCRGLYWQCVYVHSVTAGQSELNEARIWYTQTPTLTNSREPSCDLLKFIYEEFRRKTSYIHIYETE